MHPVSAVGSGACSLPDVHSTVALHHTSYDALTNMLAQRRAEAQHPVAGRVV
jgi:hypothetical protein